VDERLRRSIDALPRYGLWVLRMSASVILQQQGVYAYHSPATEASYQLTLMPETGLRQLLGHLARGAAAQALAIVAAISLMMSSAYLKKSLPTRGPWKVLLRIEPKKSPFTPPQGQARKPEQLRLPQLVKPLVAEPKTTPQTGKPAKVIAAILLTVEDDKELQMPRVLERHHGYLAFGETADLNEYARYLFEAGSWNYVPGRSHIDLKGYFAFEVDDPECYPEVRKAEADLKVIEEQHPELPRVSDHLVVYALLPVGIRPLVYDQIRKQAHSDGMLKGDPKMATIYYDEHAETGFLIRSID